MTQNIQNLTLLIGLLVLAGLGCKSVTQGKPTSEKAVVKFHQMLAEEKYDQLYDESSDLLKRETSREDMVKVFRLVGTKLGPVKTSQLQSWKVGNFNLVSTTTLVYDTQFERGKGTEQFVFEVNGDEAILAGYHVNSLDLFSE